MNYLIQKIRDNQRYFILSLAIFFLLLSFLVVIPFWSTGYLYSGPDIQFHLSRIQEYTYNLKNFGLFTRIATHTFNGIGNAVVSMYPGFTTFPFLLLLLVFPPISAIYIGLLLCVFLTLCCSYFSMSILSKDRLISLYFAILYSLSTFFIQSLLLNLEIGSAIAYIFFPLAFVGLHQVLFGDYKRFYLLVIGTTLIIYSHVLSAVSIALFMGITYLLFFFFQRKNERLLRFKYLLLSCLLVVLSTAYVWLPMIKILMSQNLIQPMKVDISNSETIFGIIKNAFTNFGYSYQENGSGIGILIVLIIIFGLFVFSKINKIAKVFYLLGLLYMWITSNLFPWFVLEKLPLVGGVVQSFQMTDRFFPFLIIMFSAYGAYVIRYIDNKIYSNKYEIKRIPLIILISVSILSVFIDENAGLNKNSYYPLTQEHTLDYVPSINKGVIKNNLNILVDGYKVDDINYYNQFYFSDGIGSTDYLPDIIDDPYGTNISKNAKSISSKQYFINNKGYYFNSKTSIPGYNSINYYVNRNISNGSSIDLPFIYYNGMRYKVKVNGKTFNYTKSGRSTFKINNLPNSKYLNIQIINLPSIADFVSIALTIIGLSILLFHLFKYEKGGKR